MKKINIAVIGLGYVGLPLFEELRKYFNTFGFDKDQKKINFLKKKNKNKKNYYVTSNDYSVLNKVNLYIVTVPTPIKKNKSPDLSFIKSASVTIAKFMQKDDIVVYESTVYPGVTDNYCAPILEKYSKLKYNKDFYCAYSPERINPGDKNHTLRKIRKIVAANNPKTLNIVSSIYNKIIDAGIYKIKDIQIAEAAKVIENTQRDLNIAFVNELSIIFNKLGINTKKVIEAAGTKWNFSKFYPGLVGGHCIGIDPYYLSYIAKKNNYKSKIILAGRKLNEQMVNYIYSQFKNKLKLKKINLSKSNILIMGITFKENTDDFRNSKSIELFYKLKKESRIVHIFDPLVNLENMNNELKKYFISKPKKNFYDGILLTVPHKTFKNMGLQKIKSFQKKINIFFDIKNIFNSSKSDFTL